MISQNDYKNCGIMNLQYMKNMKKDRKYGFRKDYYRNTMKRGVTEDAVRNCFFGRNHYIYFPLSAADAADLYFIFCRRWGTQYR